MNNVSTIPKIERLDFFNGQRLFAEDLQTLDGFNRQMRWLHNLSLHTFGIGSGFVVSGNRGDREVTIAPGYAIDNQGREIILLTPRVETVPPVADDGFGNPQFYDLTVHYPGIEDLEELENRTGLCSTNGVVRRREEPVFCWIELDAEPKPKIPLHRKQIAEGEKIVLARISVKNCQLESLSIATRRNVRPDRLPYVACGHTPKGGTQWEPWVVSLADSEGGTFDVPLGVLVRNVNTSEAKFASVPCYTARIVGERVFSNVPLAQPDDFIVEGFTMIDPGATSTQFSFRVFLPSFSLGPIAVNPITITSTSGLTAPRIAGLPIDSFFRDTAQWHIEWMGVEG
jgi:hypothetical protein